jgi:hypothetical protein
MTKNIRPTVGAENSPKSAEVKAKAANGQPAATFEAVEKTTGVAQKANAPKTITPKPITKEFGGREGPEPTRYGDWENNGIISDF